MISKRMKMIYPTERLSHRQLVQLRSEGEIGMGGHFKNKIYGLLECRGAKYWISIGHYVKNRVFFKDEAEAIDHGYRPCARCMPDAYQRWKNKNQFNNRVKKQVQHGR